MAEPVWSDNDYPAIDYQDLSYYSEPKQKEKKASLDEARPRARLGEAGGGRGRCRGFQAPCRRLPASGLPRPSALLF